MIMKRRIFIMLMLALSIMGVRAQTIADGELSSLVSMVRMLRTKNLTTFNKAVNQLAKDRLWVEMDEISIQSPVLCNVGKDEMFRIISIMHTAGEKRQQVSTPGNFLSGESDCYNYSLYEKALKAGKSVTFHLKKRMGRQTFVIVPFKGKAAKMSASVSIGGKTEMGTDGTIVITCDGKSLTDGSVIDVTITNGSNANQSFVLLNHNTRKK